MGVICRKVPFLSNKYYLLTYLLTYELPLKKNNNAAAAADDDDNDVNV